MSLWKQAISDFKASAETPKGVSPGLFRGLSGVYPVSNRKNHTPQPRVLPSVQETPPVSPVYPVYNGKDVEYPFIDNTTISMSVSEHSCLFPAENTGKTGKTRKEESGGADGVGNTLKTNTNPPPRCPEVFPETNRINLEKPPGNLPKPPQAHQPLDPVRDREAYCARLVEMALAGAAAYAEWRRNGGDEVL